MSYTQDKSGTITINGWEKGIATSPYNGIANIQAGNIATESGEVMCNFNRIQQSQPVSIANFTATQIDSSHLQVNGGSTMVAGIWINISDAGTTGISTGNYWISNSTGINISLSSTYNGSTIGGITAGTITFSLIRNMGKPIARATEPYSDGTNQQYRYYILDANGLVWVWDTAISGSNGFAWFLADTSLLSNATGMEILNGWVLVFAGTTIWCKPTVLLGGTPGWASFFSGVMMNSKVKHFAFTGHQGKLYYTDGNFIGSIFPSTALLTGVANIQSYASYTAVSTTGTITTLIDGSIPTSATTGSKQAIPAVFFSAGSIATALQTGGTTTLSKIWYILYSQGAGTFAVYPTQTDATNGTNIVDIATGSSGTQYFNTFCPTTTSGEATITFTPQRLNLPFFETAQVIGEVSNNAIIGCKGNMLYPWNQVDPTPGDLIPLPETNSVNMITVNNMLYVFTGNKGNIYVTNGSTASLVLSVPDYCAGIAGTQPSYFEPYFVWGDAMYMRGRVWFSILDQVAANSPFPAKAGNCGGIWSFVPTQNFFIGQDTGLSLRIENQASYGSYNGVSSVLIPAQNQQGRGAQYWNGWYSSVTSPTYGIDGTDTSANTYCIIETDLIPTGEFLEKKTFANITYQLGAPLASTESVGMSYRLNATDSWTSLGTAVTESSTGLSGYFPANFEKGQWLQLQITLKPNGASGSFVRLKEIKIK